MTERLLRNYPYVLGGSAVLGLALANAARVHGLVLVLSVVVASAAGALAAEPIARVVLIALALLLAGWWWGSARLDALDSSALLAHVGEAAPSLAVVTGPARQSSFELRVPATMRRFGPLAVDEPILLELPLGRSPPQGAHLQLLARLRLPRPASNGFDERTWLRRHGVHVVVAARDWEVVGRRSGLGGYADRVHGWLAASLAPGLTGERRAVLEGVVLGEDQGLSPELRTSFRASGLYHLLNRDTKGQNNFSMALWLPMRTGALVKFDAYIRVSATRGREEKDNFFSPEQQHEKIENYAKLKGYEIAEVWRELDQSGREETHPYFQQAIERVERKETDGIIVARLDRFARSVIGAKKAIKRIEDANGKLIAVDNNFDTTTPFGKFGLTMMLAIAELESDRIQENWADVQQRVVLGRGVHISSRAPTGYVRPKDEKGVSQPLELNPKAAKVVRDVFRARGATPGKKGSKQGPRSLRDLARLLNDGEVGGPYGNNQWTSAAVAKLLRNRVYLGEARSGRYVKPKAHPAIVSQAEWESAQAARVLPAAHNGREGALLSGLLRCAGCRYLMKPDFMTDRNGEKLRLYRCRGEHAAGFCSLRTSTLGRVIEPYVVRWLFDALGPGGILARPIRAIADPDTIEELEARRAEAEAEFTFWLDKQSARKIGVERYNRGLLAREKALHALEQEIAEMQAPARVDGLQDVLSLESFWPELTIKEQRYYLSLAIDVMMLRGGRRRSIDERLHIFLKDQAPDDLPRRGYRQDQIRPFVWPEGGEVLPREAVA